MRRPTRLPAVLLVAAMLTACTPSSPMPSPPPTTDAEPVFSSDEEALAAAEVAYSKYVETVDAILNDGGSNPERLESLSSPALYEREVAGFKDLSDKGWRVVGSRTFALSLQSYNDPRVTVYSCEDLTGTDVVDSSGRSVVTDAREDKYLFEVSLEFVSSSLVVESKELWDAGASC